MIDRSGRVTISDAQIWTQKIERALIHRGPDDSGIHSSADQRCVLASRRLAVQDLSADGRMPLSNEDCTVWTAFNGEIYNFRELRIELRGLGHVFRSASDTEVLVHGYESWGTAFLERLEGMFAIALYDEKIGRLLLARDRFGEKPLYLTAGIDGHLAFASEIKALLEIPQLPRRVDPDSLWQYLTYGFVMPPRTMFANVRKLGPGEVILVDSRMSITSYSFWSPVADSFETARVRHRTFPEHVNTVRTMLRESVEARMIADVPIGAFLSGGVDSSTVVSLMAQVSGRPVETITVANEEFPELDEWPYAQRIAESVGAKAHRVDISEREAIEVLPELAWYLDEPISDPATLNTYFASRTLRKSGVIVSLVGEGADEVFLGYGNYLRYGRLAEVLRFRDHVPTPLLRAIEVLGNVALNALGARVHSDLFSRALRRQPLFLGTETFFQDSEKNGILGPNICAGTPSIEVVQRVHSSAPAALRNDPLALFSFSEVRMRMAEKLLMRVDKMSSAHSLEVRSPFLDHRLVNYVLSIPSAERAARGVTKHLLKEAVAPLIPPEVIQRRKQGFSTPMAIWLKGEMGSYFEDRLRTAGIVRDGILDAAGVGDQIRLHRSNGRPDRAIHTRLWNLLILVEWYDRFNMQGVGPSDLDLGIAA
jgi:asparagine synthase (glutamine-hydrolysing)